MKDSIDARSLELVDLVRKGDDEAAAELFDRYVQRLLRLANSRISDQLARRIDADDIVQSVFRTFFKRAKDGQFVLAQARDLWRLLAAITVNKVNTQARRHGAAKRAVSAEANDPQRAGLLGLLPEAVAREPSPSEAVVLEEELRLALDRLPADQQYIAGRWMEGDSLADIAAACGCSERKVYRVRERFREILRERLGES